MVRYKVNATLHGKRIRTDVCWKNKEEAQKFADITNRFSWRARARVVVARKNEKCLPKFKR